MAPDTPEIAETPETSETAATLVDHALVPVRERHDGWTPHKQRAFLDALADTACVKAAAQAAGMTSQSAWRLRRRPDAQAFSAAWDAALERGFDRLVSIALDRAINGTMRQRYYHGALVGEERVHHNGLLMALIRNGTAMLSHARARRLLRADWDKGMAVIEGGASDPADFSPSPYEVWDLGSHRVTNCPPPPDYRGVQNGIPGTPNYWRDLNIEESIGYARKIGKPITHDEAGRTALFGLDKLPRKIFARKRR